EYEEYRSASSALQSDPGNADANSRVGRYLCFQKSHWSAGLLLLARGADEPLRKLATQDLANPTDWTAQMELADRWWDSSEAVPGTTQKSMQRRAAFWYRRALPQLSGVTKIKTEQRIAPVERDVQGRLRFTVQIAAKTAFPASILPPET